MPEGVPKVAHPPDPAPSTTKFLLTKEEAADCERQLPSWRNAGTETRRKIEMQLAKGVVLGRELDDNGGLTTGFIAGVSDTFCSTLPPF